MIRPSLAPRERLASTNSFSRRESVKPRTRRAMYGQVKRTMIAITSPRPGWIDVIPMLQPSLLELHAATIPIEISSAGSASNTRIIVREILPNLAGPMIVYMTLLIPQTILYEAALSYLGLGVPQQIASWGGLLNDAQRFYDTAWFLMLFPGLMLVITTLAFNLLGDGLRDALDVRADR